jgi:hypothetical protein
MNLPATGLPGDDLGWSCRGNPEPVSRGDLFVPLPIKTLREASVELGIPELEIRAMIDMQKIRAIFKKGTFYIAPDEMGKIKRQRKTLPDSALKSVPAAPVYPARPAPPRPGAGPAAPPRPGAGPATPPPRKPGPTT